MSHAGRRTNCAHELAQTGHIRSTGYTANAVDERRKLAFVANPHGEAELKKCKKQGISGSWGLSGDRFGFPDFSFYGKWELVYCGKWRRVEWERFDFFASRQSVQLRSSINSLTRLCASISSPTYPYLF